MSEIQALVHDVFGTVVDWRSAVTAERQSTTVPNTSWTRAFISLIRRLLSSPCPEHRENAQSIGKCPEHREIPRASAACGRL